MTTYYIVSKQAAERGEPFVREVAEGVVSVVDVKLQWVESESARRRRATDEFDLLVRQWAPRLPPDEAYRQAVTELKGELFHSEVVGAADEEG